MSVAPGKGAQAERREREKRARREEILNAARRVFSTRGYHAATLEEIAAEAQFSKGALYGYFKSKEDLYATILEEQFDLIKAAMRHAMEVHDDPLDVLREIIRLKLQQHADRKELFAELGKGQARLAPTGGVEDESKRRLVDRFRVKFFTNLDLLTEVIEEGVSAGRIRSNVPPHHLAISLLGLIHSNFFYWLLKRSSESLETVSNHVTQLFFEGICSPMEDR